MQLLEVLREEVRDEELAQFDRMVEPTRSRVVEAVTSFLQIDPTMSITTGQESAHMLLTVSLSPLQRQVLQARSRQTST